MTNRPNQQTPVNGNFSQCRNGQPPQQYQQYQGPQFKQAPAQNTDMAYRGVRYGYGYQPISVPVKQRRPLWKKIAIGFGILLLLVGIGGALSGNGGNATNTPNGDAATATTETQVAIADDGSETTQKQPETTSVQEQQAPTETQGEMSEIPTEAVAPQEEAVEDFTVTDEFFDTSNPYSATITGILTNNTEKEYHYLQIEYTLYDTDGNQIGTAFANINNLQAGASWKFDAMTLKSPEEIGRYERGGITAW